MSRTKSRIPSAPPAAADYSPARSRQGATAVAKSATAVAKEDPAYYVMRSAARRTDAFLGAPKAFGCVFAQERRTFRDEKPLSRREEQQEAA